jgi:hypothetical protein
MTGGPDPAARTGHDMPAGEAGQARQVEVTFSPAEPKLTPGAARAVLAMLLRARENGRPH